MKRVLMIAGVLVLSLGALALWLSIEPPPEPPSGTPTGTTGEKPEPTPANEAKTTGDPGATKPQSTQLTQPNAPEAEKDSGFRPITEIRSDSDRPKSDAATTLAPSSAPGSSSEHVPAQNASSASNTESAETHTAPPTRGQDPATERPQTTTAPEPIGPREPQVTPDSRATQPSTAERSQRETAEPTPEPVVARPPPATKRPPQAPKRRQRSPAPPGRYETITTATARTQPDVSGPIAANIRRGTILNVTGSHGDWLIVYSKTKNITVYVRRDEAMLSRRPPTPSTDVPERQWPHVEQMIRQAFLKHNVVGVQVTFIGDTAYLKGTVKNDTERERAEIFARSVLEVKHVFNGIRVE